MSRRSKAPASPWVATLHLAPGWVALPAVAGQRQPFLPSRDPYLRAAKELAAGGSIPDDMISRTQLFLTHVIPSSGHGLAAAGRVRASSLADAALESCWVNGPIPVAWDDADAMVGYAAEHVLPAPATSTPVVVPAGLGPAARFQRHVQDPDHDLNETVTYVVWAAERGVALVVASGYTGPQGPGWEQFLADTDAMVATLELVGATAPPGDLP